MGLGSYEAYKLTVYGTSIKRYDYRTARNRYKCEKHYTMKAYMGNGHKPQCILGLGIRHRCKLQSPPTLSLIKEHPFVAHFPKLYCNATLDSIEVLGSTHT